jgi:hypothetical protein
MNTCLRVHGARRKREHEPLSVFVLLSLMGLMKAEEDPCAQGRLEREVKSESRAVPEAFSEA